MYVYNQGDGIEFAAWFEATPGVPTVPPSVHWRLRCVTNDKVLQDWLPATPEVISENGVITGVRAVIEIDGQLNEMQDVNNRRETKQLQVSASKGLARAKAEFYEYAVANGDY